MDMAVVIQFGNSDNKLTQNEWAHFCAYMHEIIGRNVFRIHFKGGSEWDAPWQNACYVCEISPEKIDAIKEDIIDTRKRYNQESVALVIGTTEFI